MDKINKKKYISLKYISHRFMVIGIIIFLIFVAQILLLLGLWMQGSISIFPLLWLFIAIIFICVLCWFWVLLPYKQSEKILRRFSDGYELIGYMEGGMPYLTPSSEKQICRINELFYSPEMYDMNKKQAQYLALQNQINPHFLYNTLESIRSESLIYGLDSVADMTEALATFFRYTISKVENLVFVEDELENCKTYFQIQKYRFGNRLQLHISCDEDEWETIRHYRMPKLTLQPILENSIIHGTELKIGTGNLKIQFQCTQKRLIIRISDDGIGMDEKTLWELNKKLRKDSAKVFSKQHEDRGGIALVNVNNRIHLIFGEEYGIHVYSIQGKGTDVEISIPTVVSEHEIENRGIL